LLQPEDMKTETARVRVTNPINLGSAGIKLEEHFAISSAILKFKRELV